MNYRATIEVAGDNDSLQKCFAPERLKKARTEYTIKKSKNKLVFDISSKDPTALRATLNSITRLLSVYQKMSGIVKAN